MKTFIPKASLLPGHVPEDQHVHLWQQSIAPMLEAVPVHGPEIAQKLPEMNQYHLGRFLFIDCNFPGQNFRRTASMMARHDDVDHASLHMFTHGRNRVVNGGIDFEIRPGNVYGVNLAHAVTARSTQSEALVLVLPRQLLLDEVPQIADLRGAAFAEGSVSGQLFMDHMLALRRLLPQAGMDSIPALTQSLLGLLDALVVHGDATARVAQTAMFASICRHIDQRLDDPALGVESLCAQFRCSRATLYRLFKQNGGVREHIQGRRLMACFKAITAPRHMQRRIFDIALDYGFVSPSHFSHLFRRHFGLSPSEAREMGEKRSGYRLELDLSMGGDAATDAVRMWRWVKSLTVSAAMRG